MFSQEKKEDAGMILLIKKTMPQIDISIFLSIIQYLFIILFLFQWLLLKSEVLLSHTYEYAANIWILL